jgi:uncharacterized membrane protein YfcA
MDLDSSTPQDNAPMIDIDMNSLIIFFCAALLVGTSKGGLPGVGILVVPIMAHIFSAKISTGILLPMLLMADVMAVIYYHRHADWKCLIKLIPPTVVGIIVAYLSMDHLDDQQVKSGMGIIIFTMIALIILKKKLKNSSTLFQQQGHAPALITGFLVGIATMFANAAGPIAAIYFIALGMNKDTFIGTRAWFFLLINALKIPFSFSLGLIHGQSLLLNLKALPFIGLGIFVGIYLTRRINQIWFARIVLILACVSALKMMI